MSRVLRGVLLALDEGEDGEKRNGIHQRHREDHPREGSKNEEARRQEDTAYNIVPQPTTTLTEAGSDRRTREKTRIGTGIGLDAQGPARRARWPARPVETAQRLKPCEIILL